MNRNVKFDSIVESIIELLKKRLPPLVREYIEYALTLRMSTFSASAAFFLVLSLVPLLIMVMAVIPFTPIKASDLIHILTRFTPNFVHGLIKQFIKAAYTQSVSLLSGSIIVALWSGSKGMVEMIGTLNTICRVEEDHGGIVNRIIAVFYTVALMAVVVAMLLVLVFGSQIFNFLSRAVPELMPFLSFIMRFKMLLVPVPGFVLLLFMYTFIPMQKMKIKHQIPGAFITTSAWCIFSFFFSIYVKYFGRASVYGSLATPMMVMLWLYFCVMLLFIGAVINQVLERWRDW